MNKGKGRPGELDTLIGTYHQWINARVPAASRQFRRGLVQEEICAQLAYWQIDLPEDHYCLFTHFNGQKSAKIQLLPDACEKRKAFVWGGIEEMGAWRNTLAGAVYLCKDLHWYKSYARTSEIKDQFWLDGWLPFAERRDERAGIYTDLFLDFDPTECGSIGQIVASTKRTDNGRIHLQRRVIATSLTEYLSHVVLAMKSGCISYEPSIGLVAV